MFLVNKFFSTKIKHTGLLFLFLIASLLLMVGCSHLGLQQKKISLQALDNPNNSLDQVNTTTASPHPDSTQHIPKKSDSYNKQKNAKEDLLNSETLVITATEDSANAPDDNDIAIPHDDETKLAGSDQHAQNLSIKDSIGTLLPAVKTVLPISDNEEKATQIYLSPCVDVDCAKSSAYYPYIMRNDDELAPTSYNADIWSRLRKGFRIPKGKIYPRTKIQLDWYVSHPSYLNRTFTRAKPYLHYILTEAEKRKIPTELVLLPVVESAFDPFAYSHGRASGMWQFIPSTGRIFGLKQNWWYDGRRDVIASTNAAFDYLQALADRFDGDWLLALAGYNSGAGTVSKAIKRNKRRHKKTDFWHLRLPRETSAYAPKLMAIARIVENPSKYGIDLTPIENRPQFKIVKTGSQIDLAQAAELAGIKIETLYKYNPGFNRWATAPNGPHRLLIPIEKADQFEQEIADLSAKKRLSWKRYKIRRGDSLISIGRRFNTTPQVIREVNNIKGNQIRIGKYLLIPIASKGKTYYKLNASNRLLAKQSIFAKRKNGTAKIIHPVRSGDTLWDLSRKYKVGVRSLAKWNGMAPGDALRPGKKLVIWTKHASSKKTRTRANLSQKALVRKIRYRVRSGDSLARIAQKFNVTIAKITEWNNLNRKKYLQPGQRLILYVDVTESS